MKAAPTDPDQGNVQVRRMEETTLSLEKNVSIKIGEYENWIMGNWSFS